MAQLNCEMVPLYLTSKKKEQLELYAEIVGISPEKLLEEVLTSSLDDLDRMDKIGFLVSDIRFQDQLNMFKSLSKP